MLTAIILLRLDFIDRTMNKGVISVGCCFKAKQLSTEASSTTLSRLIHCKNCTETESRPNTKSLLKIYSYSYLKK